MPRWKRALPALICCLAAGSGLLLLFSFDNKYTQPSTLTQDGRVYLDAGEIDTGRLTVAANGWELWPDALLTPVDLETNLSIPVETWVGENLTLRPFHADGSPYGTSTWRLRLHATAPIQVSMLIPEAFCASAVWVDGTPYGGTGTVEPYAPRVMDAVYSFRAEGETELVVQTANYTHYYSGLTYPPVLGSPTAVGRYSTLRAVLYGFLCFSALAVSLFSAAVWAGVRGRRDPAHLWFGLLCLAYGLRVCYPFLRTAGVPLIRPLYAVEDLGAFLLLYCAARLLCLLTGRAERPWVRYGLFPAALGMCAVGAAVPLALLPALPAFSAVYGLLVSWYQLIMSLVLLVLAVRGTGERGGGLSLCGLGVYALSLLCAVLWTGPFEPLRGAWPEEYGGFVLVLCFAALMAARSRAMAVENARLTEHLREEVGHKTEELNAAYEERRQGLSVLLHNLKSPLAAVQGYVELIRENDTALDADTQSTLTLILDRFRDVGGRVRAIQELNAGEEHPRHPACLDLTELVRQVWEEDRPDVEAGDADLLLETPPGPCPVLGDAEGLQSALENLIVNAASFTPPGGTVTLSLTQSPEWARLEVRDTGPGVPTWALPHLFERGFTTRAAEGGEGLGLHLVKTEAEACGGQVFASAQAGVGSVFTLLLPLSRRPITDKAARPGGRKDVPR